MKKLAVIFAVMAVAGCSTQNQQTVNSAAQPQAVVDSSTARNSLDWAGVYEGVLPCADCEGIKTTLILNSDNSFKLEQVYQKGKNTFMPQATEGQIEWNKSKPLIYLKEGDETRTFFIGEGYVTAYDMEGQPIQSSLNYTLKQIKVF
ncbi:copper resistance protein NlpE [Orbus mooreae]|uniref:copper resistance protein NlpE n=1 Tax=Orbus mooreae TaxID=3074107 RepID=UPI00370DC1F9